MNSAAMTVAAPYPVNVRVEPQTENRNRLTTLFRLILAFPHLILVGGPMAGLLAFGPSLRFDDEGFRMVDWDLAFSGGALGAVAVLIAIIAWFAILFTGRYPQGLWKLVVFYLRWRANAIAYFTLLRDEYPPFAEGSYPVELSIAAPEQPRDRVTVAFRILLAIPQLLVLWALTAVWFLTTMIAWFSILLLGFYPRGLYDFGVDVLRWTLRVEAYVLLLRDEYPPFSFA